MIIAPRSEIPDEPPKMTTSAAAATPGRPLSLHAAEPPARRAARQAVPAGKGRGRPLSIARAGGDLRRDRVRPRAGRPPRAAHPESRLRARARHPARATSSRSTWRGRRPLRRQGRESPLLRPRKGRLLPDRDARNARARRRRDAPRRPHAGQAHRRHDVPRRRRDVRRGVPRGLQLRRGTEAAARPRRRVQRMGVLDAVRKAMRGEDARGQGDRLRNPRRDRGRQRRARGLRGRPRRRRAGARRAAARRSSSARPTG